MNMLRDYLNDIREQPFGEAVTTVALLIMTVLCAIGAIGTTIYLFVVYPMSIVGIAVVVLSLMLITWFIRRYV